MEQENYFEKSGKQYKSKRGRKFKRLRSVFIVFIIIVVIIIIIAVGATQKKRFQVENYLKSSDVETLNKFVDNKVLRDNEECYQWYETSMLGLSNNTALAGISKSNDANKIYKSEKENISVYREPEKGVLVVEKDKKRVYVGKEQISEVILTDSKVLYINVDDENALYIYSIEDESNSKIVKKNVQQFAVYGKYIVFLDMQQNLVKMDLDTGEISALAFNIQRFFAGAHIIAQNGEQIVSVSLDGKKVKRLITNAVVVGKDSQNMYYTDLETDEGNYELYSMDLQTGERKMLGSYDEFIRAIYFVDGEMIVDTVR